MSWLKKKLGGKAQSESNPAIEDDPTRLIIGSVAGNKEDAESMARTQIERYFDTPDRSWFYLAKDVSYGYHYEIHQGGGGHPYLPSLLAGADLRKEKSVIIKPHAQRAIEVLRRTDGSLQTLMLPIEQSDTEATDKRICPSNAKMRAYSTTGEEWVKAGVAALSVGLLTLSVAGALNKSYSANLEGYYEAVDNMPLTRLFELSGRGIEGVSLPHENSLPINQWRRVTSTPLRGNQVITSLMYDGTRWSITAGNVPKVTKPTESADKKPVKPDSGQKTLPAEPTKASAPVIIAANRAPKTSVEGYREGVDLNAPAPNPLPNEQKEAQ